MADPSSVAKVELSGSTDGRGVSVVATATAGTLIHTANAVTGANNYDEIWLWAENISTSAVKLTLEFGGVTPAGDNTEVTIPPEAGLVLVIPGLVLQNALVLRAFAGTTAKINVKGYVNRVTA